VLQEPVLFSTTIGDNIAYARPEAGPDEIEAAARAAGAHGFIRRLADGYDTQVGERGMRLSGGQRQRITVARAFLKGAPILVLDEPTASVDPRTERAILQSLERLMEGRTTIFVSTRSDVARGFPATMHLARGRISPSVGPPSADGRTGERGRKTERSVRSRARRVQPVGNRAAR
jgi:ATP-binding cassette subfamily B protein